MRDKINDAIRKCFEDNGYNIRQITFESDFFNNEEKDIIDVRGRFVFRAKKI